MSDEATPTPAAPDAPPTPAPAAPEADALLGTTPPEGTTPPDETNPGPDGAKFEFLLDKYRTEGRTDEEALQEQAKGYAELQKQFGSFTGAPEAYNVELAEELADAGVVIEADDPLVGKAMEMAKEMNMSQEGFNSLINMYSELQLAEHLAIADSRNEQLQQLGNNAQSRLNNIDAFIASKFDTETVQQIQAMATTANSINAIESMIKAMKGTPMAEVDTNPAASTSAQEVQEMQFAKDEFGNRRINTDPAFRKEYERKRDLAYGTAEHRVTVG